jgi:dihydrofolate reductase
MAQLIYFAMTSLDGYIEDEDGTFDWAAPSDEVHAAANDLARAAGTMLYGRRMYETMAVWETDPSLTSRPGVVADFARIWQTADKIVYSTTLSAASTRRTAIEPNFEVDTVRGLKASAARDLMIGGANIAAEAFRAGLIDRCDLFVAPVVVGGGKPALPDRIRLDLELLDHRRFTDGTVHLQYRVANSRADR